MREQFIHKKLNAKSMAQVEQANEIIEEYQDAGYTLTLRQLYYQFVSRDLLPNTSGAYHNLGKLINNARLVGEIDWDAIEDRTRFVRSNSHWSDPRSFALSCAGQFYVDMWKNQNYAPEVWIEKDALIGVLEDVCEKWDVPYYACKGYNSQSEAYAAGKRMEKAVDRGQMPIVFHLGDHDPSGIDMTRDNKDRLDMFAGYRIRVERLALNMDQVHRYRPPPNPAKMTDTRSTDYIQKFGHSSWELDALTPQTITKLIEDAVGEIVDLDQWEEDVQRVEEGKDKLKEAARQV